jgi:hypothetical protein
MAAETIRSSVCASGTPRQISASQDPRGQHPGGAIPSRVCVDAHQAIVQGLLPPSDPLGQPRAVHVQHDDELIGIVQLRTSRPSTHLLQELAIPVAGDDLVLPLRVELDRHAGDRERRGESVVERAALCGWAHTVELCDGLPFHREEC